MEDKFYDYFIYTQGLIAALINIIVFIYLQINSNRFKDPFVTIIKWGRIIDSIIPLLTGPVLQVRILFPFLGIASNGILHNYQLTELINFSTILIIQTMICVISCISLGFLARYNVFVREKTRFYFHWTEIVRIAISQFIFPIICLSLTYKGYVQVNDYKKYYENIDKILSLYDMEKFTIVIYHPSLKNSLSCCIFLELLYHIIHILDGTYRYMVPLEMKLRKCSEEVRTATVVRITRNIHFLRLSILLPIVVAFLPTIVAFLISIVKPDLNSIFSYFITRAAVTANFYFIIAPLFFIYQLRKYNSKISHGPGLKMATKQIKFFANN